MVRLTNLIFNLQFQIPSPLQSVLKFSISDFALKRVYTLLICWEKLFNFLNSRGPLSRRRAPVVRGPQVKNSWCKLFETLYVLSPLTSAKILEDGFLTDHRV
jgi:hypothetical protein